MAPVLYLSYIPLATCATARRGARAAAEAYPERATPTPQDQKGGTGATPRHMRHGAAMAAEGLEGLVPSSPTAGPKGRHQRHTSPPALERRAARAARRNTVARDSYYIAIKYRDGLSELSEARNSYFVAIWTDSPPLFFIATQIGAGS